MNKPRSTRSKTEDNVPLRTGEEAPEEDHSPQKPLYNRIKTVLSEQGISNKELARRLKITEVTVSTWCRNTKQPPIATFFKIAKSIGVEPSALINTIDKSGI